MKLTLAAAFCTVALPAFAVTPAEVVETYADIAAAKYEDSLITAKALQAAVNAFVASPTDTTQQAAKDAWFAARVPYQQTEVYRFGNPIVDDWEGRVNAWPLDEGLMDYVDASYGGPTEENLLATLNVVSSPTFTLSGTDIDATVITPALIRDTLHEADGIESNVASGYHAIEFMLWGQDLNGTGPGAGARPASDYATGDACTNSNCDRRAAYLVAATDLLVADLEEMAANWAVGGPARAAVTTDPAAGLNAMLTGMGSLSYGELAGQRMRLGLLLNDPEEEHDCFSDNTHNSHFYDGLGVQNAYLGSYTRIDGTVVSGASLSDLVAAADPAVDAQLTAALAATMDALAALKAKADSGAMAYDQMLAPGNAEGEALIMGGVNGLIAQTASIERAMSVLGLTAAFEGSDSLDNQNAVFQ